MWCGGIIEKQTDKAATTWKNFIANAPHTGMIIVETARGMRAELPRSLLRDLVFRFFVPLDGALAVGRQLHQRVRDRSVRSAFGVVTM